MVQSLNVEALSELKKKEHPFLLLDVREPDEYEEFNLGGLLIPLGDLLNDLDKISDWKEKMIVVHCRSGKRSVAASEVLSHMGFAEVYNLEGGVLAWIQRYGI